MPDFFGLAGGSPVANPGVIVIEGSQNPETPSTPASHAPVACLAFSSVHSRTKKELTFETLSTPPPWVAPMVCLSGFECPTMPEFRTGT